MKRMSRSGAYVVAAVLITVLAGGNANAATRPNQTQVTTGRDNRPQRERLVPLLVRLAIKQLSHDLIGPRP
jgi:hypothetical protein